MSELHYLNVEDGVKQGDCTCIQHSTGHWTVYDICAGNLKPPSLEERVAKRIRMRGVSGNFGMCEHPTNPIDFLSGLGVATIFRFILSHPDMDHMDGFNALMNEKRVINFWDSGARKEKPEFEASSYLEADWDRYISVRDGRENLTVVTPKAGSRFQFANKGAEGESGGDGLYILSPDQKLIDDANESGDFNDSSYVLLYRSLGGRILIPGDAHDKTWAYVLEHHSDDVRDCSVLIAPHHGRDSGMSFDFLDVVNPTLTLFGCAPSKDLAYDQWNRRDLVKITNNQAGNISLDSHSGGIDVFVENAGFASAAGGDLSRTNRLGYPLLYSIQKTT